MADPADPHTLPIVFVHIPKTAGTSFRLAAEARLGAQSILGDYGPRSPSTSRIVKETVYNEARGKAYLLDEIKRNRIDFLTGHFHVSKYLHLFRGKVRWCTFLRNPLPRTISEYLHVTREGDYAGSLEDYANEPANCNRQSKLISGLRLEDFYFVGLTERYAESLALFNNLTGWDLPHLQLNIGRRKAARHELGDELFNKMKEHNALDQELHDRASDLLDKRLN